MRAKAFSYYKSSNPPRHQISGVVRVTVTREVVANQSMVDPDAEPEDAVPALQGDHLAVRKDEQHITRTMKDGAHPEKGDNGEEVIGQRNL